MKTPFLTRLTTAAVLSAALVGAAVAQTHAAQPHGAPSAAPAQGPGPEPSARSPQRRLVAPPAQHPGPVTGPLRLDYRYHHDRYYPAPGFTVRTLPVGSLGLGWRDGNWFFHGGVWFRPVGGRYVVAVPPSGIVVPYLPPAVVGVWIGGVPYYYANGVYYAAAADGYAVVPAPANAEAAQPMPAVPSFIVYPRNGQTGAQTDADRGACNEWAGLQVGGNADPSVFQRAFEACMDGRGYTVR